MDNKGHWLPLRILAVAGALFNSYSVRKKGVSVVNEDILEIIWVNDLSILCFTSKRIIAAVPELPELPELSLWGAPDPGEMFASEDEGMLKMKKEELYKQSPEDILKADKRNFAIPYVEIVKVELFKRFFFFRKIRITTGTKKHGFTLLNENEYYRCMFALRPLLSNRLTVS